MPKLLKDPRVPVAVLAIAMAASAVLNLWLGRGTTFSADELGWFVTSPDLDLHSALNSHYGNLVFTSRLVYKLILEVFGSSYVPFRLLASATVLLTVGLLFVYLGRRVGRVAALAPCLVLLFFGADTSHVVIGNAFIVLSAVACGLGALLALDRGDSRGDVAACALLCLGVLSYSVALAFVVGVAVSVLIRGDRGRRIWIVALPSLLYAAWWLWARGTFEDPQNLVVVSNVLLIPSWGFQQLSATLGALTGLAYSFSQSRGAGAEFSTVANLGPVLALLATAGIVWRIRRGSIPPGLWGALGVLFALWFSEGMRASVARLPNSSRYLYPGAVALLLVAAEAARGMRWTRPRLIALFAIAAAGLGANLMLLRDLSGYWRDEYSMSVRADLAGFDLAGARTNPSFDPSTVNLSFLGLTHAFEAARGRSMTEDYLAAARRYGPLGYSVSELRGASEELRSRTDAMLIAALGLRLAPAEPAAASSSDCRALHLTPGQGISLPIPSGGAVLETEGAGGAVAIRRFSSASVPVGNLAPGRPAELRIPGDGRSPPWDLLTAVSPLRVCPLR